MAALGIGISDDFTFDPETEQVVFEESETGIFCYLYPLGAIIPLVQDGGTQQAARTLQVEIDKTLHTAELAPGDTTVYLIPV